MLELSLPRSETFAFLDLRQAISLRTVELTSFETLPHLVQLLLMLHHHVHFEILDFLLLAFIFLVPLEL